MHAHIMCIETATKLCMAIKVDVMKIVTKYADRLLTRDLFAVANLLVKIF